MRQINRRNDFNYVYMYSNPTKILDSKMQADNGDFIDHPELLNGTEVGTSGGVRGKSWEREGCKYVGIKVTARSPRVNKGVLE
jgi:hypothetical protein